MKNFKQRLSPGLIDYNKYQFEKRAAVCIILKENPSALFDVLFMRRAIAEGDNWSGQIAFPGGKVDEKDTSLVFTADRECSEEMGFSPLSEGEYWGELSSVRGRKKSELLDFSIHPFVFALHKEVNIVMDPTEVDECFWIPLDNLLNKDYYKEIRYGENQLPGIIISEKDTLWGLSYMMTLDFLNRLSELPEVVQRYIDLNKGSKHYIEHLKPYF